MSDLIVVSYDKEDTAEEVLYKLMLLKSEHLIEMEDGVYVTRSMDGKVKLHQTIPLGGIGATRGAVWGTLIGLLFFAPVVGAAVGAGARYLTGKMGDIGVDDRFAKQIGEKLQPGTSALLILVGSMTGDKVLPEVSKYGGEVIHTSLPNDAEERLKAALAQG
jgi:uncharacterized membrane protein